MKAAEGSNAHFDVVCVVIFGIISPSVSGRTLTYLYEQIEGKSSRVTDRRPKGLKSQP